MIPDTATTAITTRTAKIWRREDGITQVVTLENVREELEDAKENVAAIVRINQQKLMPVLVDMRAGPGIDRETRAYYSSREGLVATKALALLVESRFTRIMANFFIKFDLPAAPTQLFTSEDEAVAWLKTFLE
jgi:hypothetical protein